MEGFDFEDTWTTNDGYPRHLWEAQLLTDDGEGDGGDDQDITDGDTDGTHDGETAERDDEGDATDDTEGATDETTEDEGLPGFTAAAALAAVLSVAFLRLADSAPEY